MTQTSTDTRFDPAHVLRAETTCSCGRTFAVKARYGRRTSDQNLAAANARSHEAAAARKFRAANPLSA